MGVGVTLVSRDEVRLTAPLAPNINHRRTVFGGSAAAVGILAGWSLLHVRMGHGGSVSRIVIQHGTIDYDHPIEADFEAIARTPAEEKWERFQHTLHRRGRARIDLEVELTSRGTSVGWCRGRYVVLPLDDAD